MAQAEAEKIGNETKRDRVRRLCLMKLQADGMRMKRGTSVDAEKAFLNRVADNISYLSDNGLCALRRSLETKGEGTARCFWPSYVTIIGLAELIEKRPLEEVPELVRWFTSRAGAEALLAGRLVAEFVFFEKRKRPPYSDQDKRMVAEWAAKWNADADRIRDRIGRGLEPFGDDGAWLSWYESTEKRVKALMQDRGAAA